jgi:hypothetical protein
VIVWVVGPAREAIQGDERLHGYDGDTGSVVFDGGHDNERIPGTHSYSTTGIVARGHIYVAGDNKVSAFVATTPRPDPTSRPRPTRLPRPASSG